MADLTTVNAALDSLEAKVETVTAAPAPTQESSDLDTILARIEAIEAKISTPAPAAPAPVPSEPVAEVPAPSSGTVPPLMPVAGP